MFSEWWTIFAIFYITKMLWYYYTFPFCRKHKIHCTLYKLYILKNSRTILAIRSICWWPIPNIQQQQATNTNPLNTPWTDSFWWYTPRESVIFPHKNALMETMTTYDPRKGLHKYGEEQFGILATTTSNNGGANNSVHFVYSALYFVLYVQNSSKQNIYKIAETVVTAKPNGWHNQIYVYTLFVIQKALCFYHYSALLRFNVINIQFSV